MDTTCQYTKCKNPYSTRIPRAAFLERKNGAKTYDLISQIHNKKVPIFRKNCRKTKKTEYPCGYSVVVRVLRFELKAVPPLCGVTAYRPFYLNGKRPFVLDTGNKKRSASLSENTSFGPSVEIRTQGLLNPIQARYQTSPHPDMYFAVRQLCYITTPFPNLQALI